MVRFANGECLCSGGSEESRSRLLAAARVRLLERMSVPSVDCRVLDVMTEGDTEGGSLPCCHPSIPHHSPARQGWLHSQLSCCRLEEIQEILPTHI